MIKKVLFVVLFTLFANSIAISAIAQDSNSLADVDLVSPYPLKVPKLSSPRDTIKNFLIHANEAVERWRDERSRSAIRRSIRRAVSCLDLSNIPLATREAVGTEKMLLLKEILDRIEIPPLEEIPDMETVIKSEKTDWTIPNTEITISQLKEGPRAGAFVFNENTINFLPQYYELSKHLPYKPEATIGAYEDWLYGPGSLLPITWFDGLHSSLYEVIGGQTAW
jgi:MscS family membrane protein